MMTILYEVHNNLYVNLTNKCPCACTFCLRQTRDHMEESGSLWLDHEPSEEEIKNEIEKFDKNKYNEVVFCGFGEPTERIETLVHMAAYFKEKWNKKIRVNTNGLGSLVNNKDIAPMFKDVVDTVSISLNTPNRERFYELTRSKFGIDSFDAMIKFASEVKKYVPNVVFTTVDTTLTKEEETECAQICENIGVTYRIRPWED